RLIGDRDHRLEAVVAAGELDHHEDLVVRDLLRLRRVHRACEHIRHRGVSGREARRARSEDEAGAEEVAARELRECGDHFRSPYFSWNSGDAKTTIQRFLSSVAWFSSESVCAESTPSRCVWCAFAVDGTFFAAVTTAVTKFARDSIVFDEIHDSFSGQPPTLGGSNST